MSEPSNPIGPPRDAPLPSLNEAAAGLYRFGTAEAAVALAGLSLEEQQVAAQRVQQQARQARRRAEAQQLEAQRDAATMQLAAGVVGGGLTALQGVSNILGAAVTTDEVDTGAIEARGLSDARATQEIGHARAQAKAAADSAQATWSGAAKLLEGGSEAATAALKAIGAADEIEAGAQANRARAEGELIDELEGDAERAARLSDRASQHAEQIARARSDAQLAAVRG